MKSPLPVSARVVVGVDTHKHLHVAAAIDEVAGVLETVTVANDSAGSAQLVTWAEGFGKVVAFFLKTGVFDLLGYRIYTQRMLLDFDSNFLFLPGQKTGSSSLSVFFRQFVGPNTIGPSEGTPEHLQYVGRKFDYPPIGAGKVSPLAADWKGRRAWVASGFREGPFYRGHHPAALVERAVGKSVFKTLAKVSTVRNPFTRTASIFAWRYQKKFNQPPHVWDSDFRKAHPPEKLVEAFSYFVHKELPSEVKMFEKMWKVRGTSCVTHWIRLEHLTQDANQVVREIFRLKRGGGWIDADQVKMNDRGARGLTVQALFDERTDLIDRVLNLFAFDFDTFEYSTEVPYK